MKHFHLLTSVVLLFAFIPGLAITTELTSSELPRGDEIIKHVNARDEGNAVSRAVLMKMIDKRGKTRVRKTHSFRKYIGDEKRTAIFYLSPRNIKDTAFLTYDYASANVDDDQWLYLPAMRKVRRISAANRGDYFLGTDFTYEDIKKETKISVEDYSHRTIGEETVDGHHTYIVEGTPVNEAIARELGYSKVKLWIDNKIWMTRKTEFFDMRRNHLKTIHTRDVKNIQGIWTAHHLEVNNHKSGHKTEFVFSNIDYQTEVSDDIFTERALRRGL